MHTGVSRCPSCQANLQATELTCPSCRLQLRGEFGAGCKFCGLDAEQRRLLDVFLSCRGVIRDMEKALGLSYPTVRNRVDTLLATLGYAGLPPAARELAGRRREVIDRLAAGELTPEEAADLLQRATE